MFGFRVRSTPSEFGRDVWVNDSFQVLSAIHVQDEQRVLPESSHTRVRVRMPVRAYFILII